jgi:hypothetical protein
VLEDDDGRHVAASRPASCGTGRSATIEAARPGEKSPETSVAAKRSTWPVTTAYTLNNRLHTVADAAARRASTGTTCGAHRAQRKHRKLFTEEVMLTKKLIYAAGAAAMLALSAPSFAQGWNGHQGSSPQQGWNGHQGSSPQQGWNGHQSSSQQQAWSGHQSNYQQNRQDFRADRRDMRQDRRDMRADRRDMRNDRFGSRYGNRYGNRFGNRFGHRYGNRYGYGNRFGGRYARAGR